MHREPIYGTTKISPIPGVFPYEERREVCYCGIIDGEKWYFYGEDEESAMRQWAFYVELMKMFEEPMPRVTT